MSRLVVRAIVVCFLVSALNASAALGQRSINDIINNNSGGQPRNDWEAFKQQKQREVDRFNRNSAVMRDSINNSMRQLQSHLESQQYQQPRYQQYPQRQSQYNNPRYQNQYQYERDNYYVRPNNQSSNYYPAPPVAPRNYSNLPIVIRCPSSSRGSIQYSLISATGSVHPYVIGPGQKQELRETTAWTIRFDTGSGQGPTSYRLEGGRSYEFSNDSGRWAFFMDHE